MKKNAAEISGVDMAGEALHLLRAAPLAGLMSYFIGSAPFVLAFLYFWAELSDGTFARERCALYSLALAALFLWMKCWQSVFCASLRATLAGDRPPPATFRTALRLVVRQGAIQPYGVLLIPAAMLVMVPFYCVHAFFQNMTVLDDGSDPDTRHLVDRAWRQALLWPRQNHVALWIVSPWILCSVIASMMLLLGLTDVARNLLPGDAGQLYATVMLVMGLLVMTPFCPFGCVVAINIASALIMIPSMADRLFGITSAFVLGGQSSYMNTTFLMAVMGLSYLCLDPLVKAVHVLRCFHGEAMHTGADLLSELRALREETT